MKKLLPLIALLLCSAIGFSQTGSLLLSQNFTGVALGNLTTANGGWTNQAASGFVQVSMNSTPLLYGGYTSGSTYISTVNAAGLDNPYKTFIGATTITATDASIYYSFVVRVGSSAGVVTANASTAAALSLRSSTGANVASFFIGKTGSNLKFGVNKTGTTGATFGSNFNFATVYLIVIRYDFVAGAGNDNVYMWVNPSLASEPATGTADASVIGGTDPTTPGTDAIAAFQVDQAASSATADFDAFKAAYGTGGVSVAANSAFAWAQLSPAGGPLAIKIDYFNASKGTNINTLNWSAECSSPQATFEIERSADGKNFTTINSITASQARCALPFSYDDASPLAGTNFYRIKMVDIDGRISYTAIVKVGSQQKDIQLVSVLPNPVSKTAQLSIATTKKDNVQLSVVSLEGKVMYKKSIQVQSGSSIVNLEIANLAPGTYFINGVFGDGQTNSIKFIKQ